MNDVHELILENSPFDQYLKSLDIDQEQFKGDILSLDDFNNDNDDDQDKNIEDDKNGISNCGDNVVRNDQHQRDIKDDSKLNIVEKSLMKFYQCYTSAIVDSNLLHPFESPFINQPNNTLDFNQLLPPLHPLSLYNIQIDNDDNDGNDENKQQKEKQDDERYLIIQLVVSILQEMKYSYWTYLFGLFVVLIGVLGWGVVMFGSIVGVVGVLKAIQLRWMRIKEQNSALKKILDDTLVITKTHIKSLTKAINLVREVELISRGYRLSTPLTPIERLEIASPLNNNSKSEKSLILRAGISKSLRSSATLLHNCIQSLTPFLTTEERVYVRSQLSALFNNDMLQAVDQTSVLDGDDGPTIEEMDSQLPIIALKAMLQEYEIMVSNYFTILVIVLSKIHYINSSNKYIMFTAADTKTSSMFTSVHSSLKQIHSRLLIENNSLKSLVSKELWDNKIPKRVLLSKPKKTIIDIFIGSTNSIAESLNSMSPLFATLHSKIAPLEKQQSSAEDEDHNNQIDLVDILGIDEVVNDFVNIKQELSQCMRNWENANRALIKIVRSIPITKNTADKQWDEREAEERVKRLLDKLRGYDTGNLDYIAEPQDDFPTTDTHSNHIVLENTDETIYEAESGFMDETIEPLSTPPIDNKPYQPTTLNLTDTISEGTNTPSSSTPPPPPPPPLPGLKRAKKPSKRTVYDPLFDPETNQMRKKNTTPQSQSSSSSSDNTNPSPQDPKIVYNYKNLIPPEKKVINELLMVLDTHKNNKK